MCIQRCCLIKGRERGSIEIFGVGFRIQLRGTQIGVVGLGVAGAADLELVSLIAEQLDLSCRATAVAMSDCTDRGQKARRSSSRSCDEACARCEIRCYLPAEVYEFVSGRRFKLSIWFDGHPRTVVALGVGSLRRMNPKSGQGPNCAPAPVRTGSAAPRRSRAAYADALRARRR